MHQDQLVPVRPTSVLHGTGAKRRTARTALTTWRTHMGELLYGRRSSWHWSLYETSPYFV